MLIDGTENCVLRMHRYESALPKNLPFPVNLGGLLAIEFLLMHWVEVRRWQDIKNHGCVNEVWVLRTPANEPIYAHE